MGKLRFDLSVSPDGFVAGPNPSLEDPLGVGGERLHGWAVATAAFRERHDEGAGADVARRYLRAGLVDEFQLHVVPVFLRQGTRLLEDLPAFTKLQIERTQVLASPTGVIHVRYRVLKRAA